MRQCSSHEALWPKGLPVLLAVAGARGAAPARRRQLAAAVVARAAPAVLPALATNERGSAAVDAVTGKWPTKGGAICVWGGEGVDDGVWCGGEWGVGLFAVPGLR